MAESFRRRSWATALRSSLRSAAAPGSPASRRCWSTRPTRSPRATCCRTPGRGPTANDLVVLFLCLLGCALLFERLLRSLLGELLGLLLTFHGASVAHAADVGKWGREDSNLRRLSRRVYSPFPFAARAHPREERL